MCRFSTLPTHPPEHNNRLGKISRDDKSYYYYYDSSGIRAKKTVDGVTTSFDTLNGVVLSFPIIAMYDGSRGKNPKINKFMKWFFYIFYPAHLFVIGLINYYA